MRSAFAGLLDTAEGRIARARALRDPRYPWYTPTIAVGEKVRHLEDLRALLDSPEVKKLYGGFGVKVRVVYDRDGEEIVSSAQIEEAVLDTDLSLVLVARV